MQEYFKRLARYNQWANQRLYAACGELSNEEYMKKRPAFFDSIHGTLNHLLAVDRLWIVRVLKQPSEITTLNQILYTGYAELKQAREIEDEKIMTVIDKLNTDNLQNSIHYHTMSGKENSMQLTWLLSHLFNHQTHHRGQVHGLLSQTTVAPPSLDIYYFLEQ